MNKATKGENQHQSKVKKIVFEERNCPMTVAMKVLGGKWKIVIINFIQEASPARFGELKRKMPGITQTMLTNQLRELEQDGIIHRTIYAEVPPRVEYGLTDLGKTLIPISSSLHQWGIMFIQRNDVLERS